MDRRSFLRGLLGGAAAVVAPERAYSFLKNNPLALDGYEYRLGAYGNLIVAQPGLVSLSELLEQWYPVVVSKACRVIVDPFCPPGQAYLLPADSEPS